MSTLAKTFEITLKICLVIGILPWIVLTFFLRHNARNIKKTVSLLKCSKAVVFNLFKICKHQTTEIRNLCTLDYKKYKFLFKNFSIYILLVS